MKETSPILPVKSAKLIGFNLWACFVLLLSGSILPAADPPKLNLQNLQSTLLICGQENQGRFQATGILIDVQRRWAITCWHVLNHGENHIALLAQSDEQGIVTNPLPYQTKWFAGQGIPFQIRYVDPQNDLALIELANLPDAQPVAELAPGSISPDQPLWIVGQPGSKNVVWDQLAAQSGKVQRQQWNWPRNQPIDSWMLTLHTSDELMSGHSGGPVFNSQQQLVGMVCAAPPKQSNLAYAVDGKTIRRFLARSYALEAVRSVFHSEANSVQPAVQQAKKMDDSDGIVRLISFCVLRCR